MKCLFLISGLLLFSLPVFCQNADSLAVVRQVDSLLHISKELIEDLEYEQALDNCLLAQKKVLYEFGRETPAYILTQLSLMTIYKKNNWHTKVDSLYTNILQITEKLYGKKSIEHAQVLIKLANIYTYDYKINVHFRKEAMQIHQALNIPGEDVYNRITGKVEKDVYFRNAAYLAYYYWHIGQYVEWESISTQIHREMTDLGITDSYAYVFNLISMAYFYRINGIQEEATEYLNQSQRLVSGPGIDTIMKIELYDKLSQLIGWDDPQKGIYWSKKSLDLKKHDIHKSRQSLRKYIFGCLYLAEFFMDAKSDSCEFYLTEASNLLIGSHIIQQDGVYAYYNWLSGFNKYYKKRYLDAYKHWLEAYNLYSTSKEKSYMYSSLFNAATALFYLDSLQVAEIIIERGLQMLQSESYFSSYFTVFKKQAAAFYSRVGKLEKSIFLNNEILSYWKDVFGETHHEYPGLLNNFGYLNWKMARYASAASAFEESNRKIQQVIKQRFYSSSESEVNGWIQDHLLPVRNIIFSILNDFPDTALMKTCYDNEIFHKGILRYAKYRIRNIALSDTLSALIYAELDRYYQKLGAEYTKPLLEQKGVREIQESIMKLETELGFSIKGKGEIIKDVVATTVGNTLKFDEAAMELVNYDYCIPIANENIHLTPITNYNSVDLKYFELTGRSLYGALLLLPGKLWPIWVPLCDQKSLESLIKATGERRIDYVNSLYTQAGRGVTPLGQPQKTLYELIWKPIEPYLSGTNTIYYSSAGMLHRLNLPAIPINPDSVLADRYQLVELGSTRQLVVSTDRKDNNNDALLFGGIYYDMDSSAISRTNGALKPENTIVSRKELNFSFTDSTLRGSTWTYLPFTEKEVSGVEQILKSGGIQTQICKGYAATEEIYKSIGLGGKPSPRILHLATHGFFFPDPKAVGSGQLAVGSEETVFKISDHPMIRSGLILAGGNHAWKTGKPLREGMEDGILTAYEITQMNLSNTELVVLSACETGLGDIQGNEGVYGLQRAFKIAGAKYLIMSLWQVPDKQTSLLMTTFYKKWLEEKMTIPEAFRAAQKELREAGLDPYQWAGFVLVE